MQLFINNWSAVLTASATASAVLISVDPAHAALLSGLGSGAHYVLTLAEISTTGEELRREIVHCTAAAAGSLTVTRAQEGTAAQVWDVGAIIEARLTAETMEALQASGSATPSDAAPLPLGAAAAPGASGELSRADHVHPRPTPAAIGAATAAQGAKADTAIQAIEKGAASGVATLGSDSKIPLAQLPATAITSTFVVNTEAAMLALSAQEGDVAVRPDISKSFILKAEPSSTLGNWQELLSPASGGGAPVGSDTPQPLGTPSPGVSSSASRQDHVHAMPSPAAVGADPAGSAAAAQAAAVQRDNHSGTQTANTISDFASAARAQTEAELVAGSNITITPSGSGATRQLTIASTGGGGADNSTETVAISSGALNLSATTKEVIVVDLNQNVTSITLPAGVAGQAVNRRIVFTQSGASTFTVTGWTSVTIEGGTAPVAATGASAVTEYMLSNTNNGGWRMYVDQAGSGSGLTAGTAQNATGTAIDFTGIPSTAKRITVMLAGISTNGGSVPLIRLGAGSVQASGYLGSGGDFAAGGVGTNAETAGFRLHGGWASGVTLHGALTLCKLSGNTWVASGVNARSDSGTCGASAGSVTLSGELDRVRLTTANGTDSFDAGSVNIMWE